MENATYGISTEALEWIRVEYQEAPPGKFPCSPAIPQEIWDGIPRKQLAIPYTDGTDRQKLDLYLPPEASAENPVPLVMFIHGGGFTGGYREDLQCSLYFPLLNCGYAVASVGYRLAPDDKFPTAVLDVKAAVRFMKANCREYGIDGGRIALAGGSAGAYYALMTGLTSRIPGLEDAKLGNAAYDSSVQAIIALYPPVEFTAIDAQRAENAVEGDPLAPPPAGPTAEELLFGMPVEELSEETVRFSDPKTYITPQIPPLLMRHGDADAVVPFQQSRDFADKVRAVAGEDRVDYALVPGAAHGQGDLRLPVMTEQAKAFLDKVLKA